MTTDRFTTIDDTTENVNILVAHLREQEDGHYLYRGQTKVYDGPLL